MTAETIGTEVLSPYNSLARLGGVADLRKQWRDGTVLRIRCGGNPVAADDWLFVKTSLSYPLLSVGTGTSYLLQVLVSRRGYGMLGDDPRHDAKWATIPARLAVGESFTIYRTPLVLSGAIIEESLVVTDTIAEVASAGIDW